MATQVILTGITGQQPSIFYIAYLPCLLNEIGQGFVQSVGHFLVYSHEYKFFRGQSKHDKYRRLLLGKINNLELKSTY